jgi:hypothetical protein
LGERAENLELAIAAYKAALEIRTRSAFPEQWATTQNNLGNAYKNRILGERAENLELAIATHGRSLVMVNLDLLFNAITGVANPLIKEKIQRNETVIKLLQQFNLSPEHPPADYSDVYAYTLVEYGVGKPKAILELFRQEAIKLAFRKAFDHNNPSILLSEVDAFVAAYAFGYGTGIFVCGATENGAGY